jgi:uncharacterized protein YjbI with pentapeptide repeats
VSELERGGDLDGLELVGLDLTGQDARDARFLECTLRDCVLDGVPFGGARVIDTTWSEVRADALAAERSEWRDVTLTD